VTFQQLRRDCRDADVAALVAALHSDEEIRRYPIRAAAARHLGHIGARDAVPALVRLLNDADETVRTAAATALGKIGDPRAVSRLLEAINDPHPSVRARVIGSLGEIGAEAAIPRLIEIAETGGWFFERAPALYALSLIPHEDAQRTAELLLARERFLRRRSVRTAARKFEKRRGRRNRRRHWFRSAQPSAGE
jgi:HEAT repeat protein